MEFKNLELGEISHALAADDFKVCRINVKVDLEEIQKITRSILTNHQLIKKDGYALYSSIGLQYDDENDPYYDAVKQTTHINPDGTPTYLRKNHGRFLKINSIGQQYFQFFGKLQSYFYLNRGKLLCSHPGHKMKQHTDGIFYANLHLPIFTNLNAKIVIEDEEFHLPKDGFFYLVNASRRHYAKNEGEEDRMHITFGISPPVIKNLDLEMKMKMKKFYDLNGFDINQNP